MHFRGGITTQIRTFGWSFVRHPPDTHGSSEFETNILFFSNTTLHKNNDDIPLTVRSPLDIFLQSYLFFIFWILFRSSMVSYFMLRL